MPGAIRTIGLTKYFGPVVGVERLSLEVHEGEIFGFLGPNGSGKTTTIRLLLDLLRPTDGDAWVFGFHCRRQGLEVRRHIGYLPGDLPIYPELTGARFLRFLEAVARQTSPAAWLDHLLRRFDVSDVDLARPLRDYSQGMKRKLGIVQALAAKPRVLILDEPTNGLDPLMIEAFTQTIDELKREGGTTIFLSSHVLSEVEKTCDRVGLIRRGELAVVESLAVLGTHMPRRVTVTFATPVGRGQLEAVGITASPAPDGSTGRVSPVHDVSGADGTAIPSNSVRAVVAGPSGDSAVSGREAVSIRWTLDVHGPLGPLVRALNGLPVADLHVENFTLEDYVLRFYASGEP